ncbi:MAG: hypothetical protein LBR56_07375 [Sporomusaceae bacterium]|jgi:hypothetical protein|nr:hypothetical protein [Sporomusaceae bacterium]
MNSKMKEKMLEIQKLEDKYGLILFRMGLTHLFDCGHRHITEENVEESIEQIIAEGEMNKANGVTSVMTPQFQCGILRCAYDLSKFSILELFAYIKKHFIISD